MAGMLSPFFFIFFEKIVFFFKIICIFAMWDGTTTAHTRSPGLTKYNIKSLYKWKIQ